MLDELGQGKNGVQNTRTEHEQSPLYLAVHRYRDFEQVLNKLLQHSSVVARTDHLARLFSTQGYDPNEKIGAASADKGEITAEIDSELKSLVGEFRDKIIQGMRRRDSLIRPEELKDEHGRAIDRGGVVQYLDIKIGMLRTVIRDSIEQLLQRPAKDPHVDDLLVRKILSLGSSEGLNFVDKQDIRDPLTRAVLSAFSDVIVSPEFSPPSELSSIQEQFLRGIFSPPGSLGQSSESLLCTAIEAAKRDAATTRRLFIFGEYDGKSPRELAEIKVHYAEKAVLSVIRSISHIEYVAAQGQSSSGEINLTNCTFGAAKILRITPYMSSALTSQMRNFLRDDSVRDVVHRTHNIKNFNLYLSKAGDHSRQTPPLWPTSGDPNVP